MHCVFYVIAIFFATFNSIYSRPYDEDVISKNREALEHVNIKEILKNDQLVSFYVKCVLGEGKCNPEGKKIVAGIDFVLRDSCENCTNQEKAKLRYLHNFFVTKRKPDFDKLVQKYDPTGVRLPKLLDIIKENETKTVEDFLKKSRSVNFNDILQSDRLFSAYHACFMDRGPCRKDAREVKETIPALVKTSCESCTLEQKKELKKYLDYARGNRVKEWEEVLNKYDPQHTSLEKFLSGIQDK